ncbi:MAG: KTSC domain-containing protein [Pseudomonadota bacterium]
MKKVNAGNLRAIGYDEWTRVLQVETTVGKFQYTGVSADVYRRFAGSSSMWSYYRDNIEDEFAATRLRS